MSKLYDLLNSMISRINDSVKTINGSKPDASGNIAVEIPETEPNGIVVTITFDDSGNLIADKTYDEVYAAVHLGGNVVCRMNNSVLKVVSVNPDEGFIEFRDVILFTGEEDRVGSFYIVLWSDNAIDIRENYSNPILSEDSINALIDVKLGVIENGSY